MNAEIELTPVQLRVLGALMEKSVTTPEYYPLTLNSLIAATNQKTSREPIMELDEDEVLGALDVLRDHRLVIRVDVAGSRVAKFRQNIGAQFELNAAEFAVLTILILRGDQTLGQIRSRTDRLYAFPSLDVLYEILRGLEYRALDPIVLVKPVPIRPGNKEVRYRHTLGGEMVRLVEEPVKEKELESHLPGPEGPSDLEMLQAEVASLKVELAGLKDAFEQFKGRF